MTDHIYPKSIFSKRMRDLTFEAQQLAKSPAPAVAVTTPRPVSAISVPVSLNMLQELVDVLSVSQDSVSNGSMWAQRVQTLPHPDFESQLGAHHTSKKPQSARAASINSARSSRAATADSKYVSDRELRSSAESLTDPKLGKPTRTTILRARQRCHSAPVNAYETRRERQKKFYAGTDFHKSLMTSIDHEMRDLVSNGVPAGESIHSYYTGARYNRKDCLDAKSLKKMGVFMPRNDPKNLFMLKGYTPKNIPPETAAPPATPDNNGDAAPNASMEDQTKMADEGNHTDISDQTHEVSNCVTKSSVASNASCAVNTLTTAGPKLKGAKQERERLCSSHDVHQRAPSKSATTRRRSPSDSSACSLHIQGKTLVLGGPVPETTPAEVNPTRPPPPTPRCNSATALDVMHKLIVENHLNKPQDFGSDCPVNSFRANTNTNAASATEGNCYASDDLNYVSVVIPHYWNAGNAVHNELLYRNTNSYLYAHESENYPLNDDAVMSGYTQKEESISNNANMSLLVDKFRNPFSNVTVTIEGKESQNQDIKKNSGKSRKGSTSVPLLLVDIKPKKSRRKVV